MLQFNLVNFGYDSWSSYWKRNQLLFKMLADQEYINSSFYINSAVWFTSLLRHPFSCISQPARNKLGYLIPLRVQKKITVFTPIILPFQYRAPLLSGISNFFSRRVTREYGSLPLIAIANTPSLFPNDTLAALWKSAAIKIFDWSDDFAAFTTNPHESEKINSHVCRYITEADLVITINDRLTERARQWNKNAHTLKNATNLLAFSNHQPPVSFKNPIADLTAPIIGYVGWLNELRLDVELLYYLASKRPDWQFVFIGPCSHANPLGDRLSSLHNIHVIKPVAYELLPSLYDKINVCILPNRINDHTKGNDPIKIYEYLASGKPVVTTPTSGTEVFPDALLIANTNEQFLAHIETALQEKDPALIEKRIALGRENSWERRFKELQAYLLPLIEQAARKEKTS